jgi:hypothetical protein
MRLVKCVCGNQDFTPLNILAREYVVISVKVDSPIASLQDLTARLKKDAQSVTFAFATARGNHNHIVMSMYLKSIGVDPKVAKTVIYPGGGPALTALLGGHIDVYVPRRAAWSRSRRKAGPGFSPFPRLSGNRGTWPAWPRSGNRASMPSFSPGAASWRPRG